MKKNYNTINGCIHLYNPKKEGLGAYDVHYINACKKNRNLGIDKTKKNDRRFVA
tara:strand:+ start:132 stop:293 length:162 start_codon:yes stop_codon:yes gene_type:complete